MRNSVSKVAKFVLVSVVAIGCGADGNNKKKPKPAPVGTAKDLKDFRNDYFLEDKDCIVQSESIPLSEMKVRQWAGSGTEELVVKTTGVTGSPVLSGPVVADTYVSHLKHEYWIEGSGGRVYDRDKSEFNPPVPLKVCNPKGDYQRNSYEGVALTGLYFIEKAYNYFYKITGGDALPKVNFFVLPEIRVFTTYESGPLSGEQEEMSFENNLTYIDNYYSRPSIMVHPNTQSPVDDLSGNNLWETEWGMAHEFGHHVLTTLSGYSKGDFSASIVDSVFIDSHSDVNLLLATEAPTMSGLRRVGAKDAWGAFNEAFADLYGFYSAGKKPKLMEGLKCFGASRDVLSEDFTNGELKRITDYNYDTFYSTSRVQGQGCSGANFQSIHSVGAVIAHGLHKLHEVSGSTQDPGEKLMVLGRIMKNFVATRNKRFTLADLIGEGIKVFASRDEISTGATILPLTSTIPQSACETAGSIFPGILAEFGASSPIKCQ